MSQNTSQKNSISNFKPRLIGFYNNGYYGMTTNDKLNISYRIGLIDMLLLCYNDNPSFYLSNATFNSIVSTLKK